MFGEEEIEMIPRLLSNSLSDNDDSSSNDNDLKSMYTDSNHSLKKDISSVKRTKTATIVFLILALTFCMYV